MRKPGEGLAVAHYFPAVWGIIHAEREHAKQLLAFAQYPYGIALHVVTDGIRHCAHIGKFKRLANRRFAGIPRPVIRSHRIVEGAEIHYKPLVVIIEKFAVGFNFVNRTEPVIERPVHARTGFDEHTRNGREVLIERQVAYFAAIQMNPEPYIGVIGVRKRDVHMGKIESRYRVDRGKRHHFYQTVVFRKARNIYYVVKFHFVVVALAGKHHCVFLPGFEVIRSYAHAVVTAVFDTLCKPCGQILIRGDRNAGACRP